MPRLAISITLGILTSAFGCYLAQHFIPAGTPRLLAEVLAVISGLAPVALYRDRP